MYNERGSRNFNKSVSVKNTMVRTSLNSQLTMNTVVQAKKIRELKENEVKKLHNRIALLQ
jgi:hypothetical protein